MIAGILLAAGRGERFGTNKLLVEVAGRPLIFYSLKNCVDSRLTEIVVVLGAEGDIVEGEIRRHFADEKKIRLVMNEDHERGMMSSLKVGIRSLDVNCRGAMVLLADMPLVTVDIIDRLIDAFAREKGIVAPECDGNLFHPRILPALILPEFLDLEDGEKGTVVLDRHRERIVRVNAGDRMMFLDIDHPDDFEIVSRRLTSRLD